MESERLMKLRQWVVIVLGILLSGLFLWLALRDLDLNAVAQNLLRTDPLLYLVSILSVLLSLWARAVRWRGLLNNRLPAAQSFHMLNLGMMLNQLPLRFGEVARSALVLRADIPFMTGATSIVVERLLDLVTVLVLLAWSVARAPNAAPVVSSSAILFGIAAVVAFIVLVAFARYPQIAHRMLAWVERLLPFVKRFKLVTLIDHVLEGLRPLTDLRRFVHAVLWTVIAWVISYSTYHLICLSLDISVPDVVLFGILTMCLTSLGIAIPAMVAGIGVFQGAARLAGEIVGVAGQDAAAFGILVHATAVGSYVVLGIIGLMILGVNLSNLLSTRQEEPAVEPAPPAA